MKRQAIFVAVLIVGVAALYLSERRRESTAVSANAVVTTSHRVYGRDSSSEKRISAKGVRPR